MRIGHRLSDVTINEKMPTDLMRNKWANPPVSADAQSCTFSKGEILSAEASRMLPLFFLEVD